MIRAIGGCDKLQRSWKKLTAGGRSHDASAVSAASDDVTRTARKRKNNNH